MAEQKIYEGRAELNNEPFLSSLTKMEQESQKTVGVLQKIFDQLDTSLTATLTRANTNLKAISSGMVSTSRVLQQIATGQNQTAQQSTQAATSQASAAQKSADTALRLAQAQARGLAVTKEYAAAIQHLDTAIKANTGTSATVLQNAQNQIAALQQRQLQTEAQAQKMRDAQAAQGMQTALQQEQRRANATLAEQRNAHQQELTLLKAAQRDENRLLERGIADRIRLMQAGKQEEMKKLKGELEAETRLIQQQIAEQVKIRQQAQQKAAEQLQNASKYAGGTSSVGLNEETYQRAVQAAEIAKTKEENLRKQLTATTRAEAAAMQLAISRGYDSEAARNRALAGHSGFIAALRAGVEKARIDLQKLEDQWNSIYRAGSQLSQLGGMMSVFSAGLSAVGYSLAKDAGEFDFWIARSIAAAQVANDQYGIVAEKGVLTAETFRTMALELGRGVGVLDPNQIAQGWYAYQAALGSTVQTTEDLALQQYNLDKAFKASVITGDAPDKIARSVSAALAQWGAGADQFEYYLSVMMNVGQITQAEFGDIAQTFEKIGPQAARVGINIGQMATVAGLLAQNGVKGGSAGRLFAAGIRAIVDPADDANATLQELLVKSQGLQGNWRQFVADANGNMDIEKVFTSLNRALKELNPLEAEAKIAQIFGAEGSRTWGTLIATFDQSAPKFRQLRKEFQDVNAQTAAFGKQWEIVAASSKVQMGQMLYAFQELKERLGTIIATNLIPVLGFVQRLTFAFLEWAQTHPEVADGIVKVALAVAVLLGVVGPLLAGLGFMVQGFAGLPIAFAVLRAGFVTVRGGLLALLPMFRTVGAAAGLAGAEIAGVGATTAGAGAAIGSLAVPILAVIAVLALLFLAWRNNWFGIRDTLSTLVGELQSMIAAFGGVLSGLLTVITGILTGSNELIKQGMKELALALIEVIYVIPEAVATTLTTAVHQLETWSASTFNTLTRNMLVWGQNMMIALANGIVDGSRAVMAAAYAVAEYISQYFRSFSPPKFGPLRHIKVWGTNLINSLIDGMQAADFEAVTKIADQIGVALKRNIEDGIAQPSVYANTMGAANNLVDDMLEIVRQGGRVNDDFFSSLQSGLGEWYSYISQIALAYQDVYANERMLKLEKDKLEAIKEQRSELERQNKLRIEAFDTYLGSTDGLGVQQNQAAMVDPTSAEGQAKIAEMKRSLSREDFQNWLNFQKKLWTERAAIEDGNLKKQEDATQAQVSVYEQQLAAAQKQYDMYAAMYEYAVKMYELAEEQSRLEEQQRQAATAGGASVSKSPYGTPEDLKQFAEEIARAVGGDKALADEQTLRSKHGGDDIAALGDATKQRTQEEARVAELDKLNRKKRAEFEVALINATSEEERQRIKQQKDAWDAAYREEKARLQERVSFAREIQDAAEKQADASAAGRTGPVEAQFAKEILKLLGAQTATIEDANELKKTAGTLDQAQLDAKAQLTEEERKLRDLQAYGDQKKLEFEQRLREAGNDPEKVRRIKEEQDAWEMAYKRAIEAQQARVEAARRAQQDLQALASQDTLNTKAVGGGAAGKLPNPALGSFPGMRSAAEEVAGNGDFLGDFKQRLEDSLKSSFPNPDEIRPSQLKAIQAFDDLKRGLNFLRDESITTEQKLRMLGETLKSALGWQQWEDAIMSKPAREQLLARMGVLKEGLLDWGSTIQRGFNVALVWFQGIPEHIGNALKSAGDVLTRWGDDAVRPLQKFNEETRANFKAWADDVGGRWDEWVETLKRGWGRMGEWVDEFKGNFDKGVTQLQELGNKVVDVFLWPVYFIVGAAALAFIPLKILWSEMMVLFSDKLDEANAKLKEWATAYTTWETNVNDTVNKWVDHQTERYTAWSDNVNDTVNKWADHQTERYTAWSDNVNDTVNKWADHQTERYTAWSGSVNDTVNKWVDHQTERYTTWSTGVNKTVDDWVTYQSRKYTDWSTGVNKTVDEWFLYQAGRYTSWSENVNKIVNTWIDEQMTKFNGWKKAVGDTLGAALDGVKSAADNVLKPLRDFIDLLNDIAEVGKRILQWKPPATSSSGGNSGEGGSSGGRGYAGGLVSVPYDLYNAYLHKGERVLTASEAAVYNQLETTMRGFVSSPSTTSNTNHTSATKNVNINVEKLDARNPDEGRAFLSQVAFLS